MKTDLSYEAEEYVEMIYRLQKQKGVAKTKDLSEALNVVPGSITNTIGHLEKHQLVIHEPYRGVKLTAKGEKIALDVLRRHRLTERLLTDVLNAEWSSVHEDACKIEHALSKNVAMLLEKRLGYPKFCPHGNPIPTENGTIQEEKCFTLTEIRSGENCIVTRIINEKHENLVLLAEKGLKPKVLVQVIKHRPSHLILSVNGKARHLDRDLAVNVFVKKIERNNHALQAQA